MQLASNSCWLAVRLQVPEADAAAIFLDFQFHFQGEGNSIQKRVEYVRKYIVLSKKELRIKFIP